MIQRLVFIIFCWMFSSCSSMAGDALSNQSLAYVLPDKVMCDISSTEFKRAISISYIDIGRREYKFSYFGSKYIDGKIDNIKADDLELKDGSVATRYKINASFENNDAIHRRNEYHLIEIWINDTGYFVQHRYTALFVDGSLDLVATQSKLNTAFDCRPVPI